jgi:hypothetical protein
MISIPTRSSLGLLRFQHTIYIKPVLNLDHLSFLFKYRPGLISLNTTIFSCIVVLLDRENGFELIMCYIWRPALELQYSSQFSAPSIKNVANAWKKIPWGSNSPISTEMKCTDFFRRVGHLIIDTPDMPGNLTLWDLFFLLFEIKVLNMDFFAVNL